MDWVRIHIPTHIRGKACAASSLEGIGAWLLCLSYCYEKENGGRIKGASEWKDRQLQQEIGVGRAEILAAKGLVSIDLSDLVVAGYELSTGSKKGTENTLFDVSEYVLPENVTPSMLAHLWNKHCGTLPKVSKPDALTGTRITHAKARLEEVPDLSRWEIAIKAMSMSGFCTGKQSYTGPHSGWVANFDFLVRPNTLIKIEEGSFGCNVALVTSAVGTDTAEPTYIMPEVFRYLMDGELWEGYLCGDDAKSQQGIWDATFPPHKMKCHASIKDAFVEVSKRVADGTPFGKNIMDWFNAFTHGRVNSITVSAAPGLAAMGIDLNAEGLKIEDTMNLSGLKLTDEGGNPL